MPTRDSYAADPSAGDVLTAANFRKLPGGWIDAEESTSTFTTSGTTELDLLSASVTVDANRKLRVTFHVSKCGTTVNADEFLIRLYFDGTTFQRYLVNRPDQTMDDGISFSGVVNTTTAGAKTIKCTAQRLSGTGVVQLTSAAGFPMQMTVEDIGPSS